MTHMILLAEDDPSIADTVIYALETEGFQTLRQTLGTETIEYISKYPVDLIILDVGLPDINGFEVCKKIRSFSEIPIIFLTARQEEIDRVVGLEIGADDYIIKPFSPRELTARVKTILKRVQRIAPAVVTSSGFSIDEKASRISYNGQTIDLTRYEYRLLKIFLSQPGRIFSREQLMDQAWESPESSTDRTVDAHIKSLRAKLSKFADGFDGIKTHRGMGYSFEQ